MAGRASKPIAELETLLNTAEYQQAINVVRDVLQESLMSNLSSTGTWEEIHYQYGLYAVVSRAKSTRRILAKAHKLHERNQTVTCENFFKLMPDLVGGRLVAIDPGDLFNLAEVVRAGFQPPYFYPPGSGFTSLRVRRGALSIYDSGAFSKAGYVVETEETGYCSVHFVFRLGGEIFNHCSQKDRSIITKFAKHVPLDQWHVEVQVRTIMDEAWGEVDHFVRYEDPALRSDKHMTAHFTALAGFLQAANHHVQIIRNLARRSAAK